MLDTVAIAALVGVLGRGPDGVLPGRLLSCKQPKPQCQQLEERQADLSTSGHAAKYVVLRTDEARAQHTKARCNSVRLEVNSRPLTEITINSCQKTSDSTLVVPGHTHTSG